LNTFTYIILLYKYYRKNRHYKFSKISKTKFRRLIKAFAMGFTATDNAELTGLSIRSANDLFQSALTRWCLMKIILVKIGVKQ